MDVDAYLQTFIVEAEELLEQMETLLLSLEQGQQDEDSLNALFRAAHTIKGSAGMFGLLPIVDFTHKIENILDQARDGRIELSQDLIGILLSCRDHIAELVSHTKHNTPIDAACANRGATLVSTLGGWFNETDQQQTNPASEKDKPRIAQWMYGYKLGQRFCIHQ